MEGSRSFSRYQSVQLIAGDSVFDSPSELLLFERMADANFANRLLNFLVFNIFSASLEYFCFEVKPAIADFFGHLQAVATGSEPNNNRPFRLMYCNKLLLIKGIVQVFCSKQKNCWRVS